MHPERRRQRRHLTVKPASEPAQGRPMVPSFVFLSCDPCVSWFKRILPASCAFALLTYSQIIEPVRGHPLFMT